MAACFTGGGASSWPRPLGRSGCVTASSTSWPALTIASSVGIAKAGVPRKIMRIKVQGRRHAAANELSASTSRPLAGLGQLADFPFDQIAFERADVLDVQLAVQVIEDRKSV